MLINVPQYIDVEDKIVGPLTMKQLGWIIALGIILMLLWSMAPMPIFLIAGLPITMLFVALAFFKPYGQPMGGFVIFGIMYFFRPKVYIWQRAPENVISIPQKAKEKAKENFHPDKHMTSESLRDLAQLLDSEGSTYNENIEELLKKQPIKKA